MIYKLIGLNCSLGQTVVSAAEGVAPFVAASLLDRLVFCSLAVYKPLIKMKLDIARSEQMAERNEEMTSFCLGGNVLLIEMMQLTQKKQLFFRHNVD